MNECGLFRLLNQTTLWSITSSRIVDTMLFSRLMLMCYTWQVTAEHQSAQMSKKLQMTA